MRPLAAILLLACLGALWAFTRADLADYAGFKRLTDTADRQKRYRAWVLKSFALFFVGSIVCLLLLGRLGALGRLPPEFAGLSQSLRAAAPMRELPVGGILGGVIGGVIASVLLGIVIARRKAGAAPGLVLGDIEPLFPRNWAETAHTAALSLNAGVSEEVFFRLLLPLLLTLAVGDARYAFLAAAAVFGLVHIYQGWIGVLATAVVGLIFTCLYLWSGTLLAPICAHVLLDLIGLVVRPTLARLAAAR